MRFQTDLVPARLTRRYKRFLADCVLESDGREITAHCANPGAMQGLADPGTRVWLEPNDNPARKLKFGLRIVDHENGHFTGVDTSLPNKLIRDALRAGHIPTLDTYDTVRAEVPYGDGSRVDFVLTGQGQPDAYVEVKSVTLSRAAGRAEFPDSVTARGAKHLRELATMAQTGRRAVLLYVVQRTDAQRLHLAQDIDPAYARASEAASAAGVETLAFRTNISPRGITLGSPLAMEH